MTTELHLADLILSTVVIIGLLSVSALVCQKLKLPGIVGFIIAGVIIGPDGVAFINTMPGANLIAELAVIFLLFTIGLELSFKTLKKNWQLIVTSGLGQVVLTVAFFAVICHWLLHLNWPQSLLWGCLISLSSSAIVMKLLIDNREVNSTYGTAATGMLLSQDILVIPMTLAMALLSAGEAGGHDFALSYDKLLLWGGMLVGVCVFLYVSARFIVPFVLERVSKTKNRELFFFAVLLLCLGFSLIFEKLNLSLALGAFLSGLVISESHFGRQATSEIILLRDSFLALFFVSTGMLLDLNFVAKNFFWIILFTLLTIGGKVFIGTLVAWLARVPLKSAIICGLFIAQIGELSFVLAELGLDNKLLSHTHFQYFLSITVITMMITPLFFRFAPRLVLAHVGAEQKSSVATPRAKKIDAIIIGYGVAGQALANWLRDEGKIFRIVEQNYELVKKAHATGLAIVYGDGSNAQTLHNADFTSAKLIVVCVAGVVATSAIVENILRLQPEATVLVRVQYRREAILLANMLDRKMIIDSETISSRRLVAKVKSLLA